MEKILILVFDCSKPTSLYVHLQGQHMAMMCTFVLPLAACLSILPIKPTDNSLASPLNTLAAPGSRSIMDTSPQEQAPWPYAVTSQTAIINKQMFIKVLCWGSCPCLTQYWRISLWVQANSFEIQIIRLSLSLQQFMFFKYDLYSPNIFPSYFYSFVVEIK